MKKLFLMFICVELSGCNISSPSLSDEIILGRLISLPIEKLVFAMHLPEIWEVRS